MPVSGNDYSKLPVVPMKWGETCRDNTTGWIAMGKLLRRLAFFALIFEGLGRIDLPVLVVAIAVTAAIVACTHFLLQSDANSA